MDYEGGDVATLVLHYESLYCGGRWDLSFFSFIESCERTNNVVVREEPRTAITNKKKIKQNGAHRG